MPCGADGRRFRFAGSDAGRHSANRRIYPVARIDREIRTDGRVSRAVRRIVICVSSVLGLITAIVVLMRRLSLIVLFVGSMLMSAAVAAAENTPAGPPSQLGLPTVPVPLDDPLTPAKVELGRKLFFDDRLSPAGGVSCASCHVPETGFTQTDRSRAIGRNGTPLRRNAPTLLNTAYLLRYFHDGRVTTLEEQALMLFTDAQEFNAPSMDWVVARIAELDDYDGLFQEAFDAPADADRIARALAAFQRRLIAANSPFDRWFYGKEAEALSESAVRGFRVFREEGLCAACHRVDDDNALFTDNKFHDTGIAWRNAQSVKEGEADRGREEATGLIWERYKIKTPTLRNVALTGPYMHDGSIETLEGAVRFYVRGGIDHPTLSALIGPLDLSARDIADLVAFLESLTSPHVAELVGWVRDEGRGNPVSPVQKTK